MKMHFIKELEVPDYEEYFEDEIKRKATRLVFEMNVGNCYSFSKEIKKTWVRIDYIGYNEKIINSPNARHFNSLNEVDIRMAYTQSIFMTLDMILRYPSARMIFKEDDIPEIRDFFSTEITMKGTWTLYGVSASEGDWKNLRGRMLGFLSDSTNTEVAIMQKSSHPFKKGNFYVNGGEYGKCTLLEDEEGFYRLARTEIVKKIPDAH